MDIGHKEWEAAGQSVAKERNKEEREELVKEWKQTNKIKKSSKDEKLNS
jgi:hypothetical protein